MILAISRQVSKIINSCDLVCSTYDAIHTDHGLFSIKMKDVLNGGLEHNIDLFHEDTRYRLLRKGFMTGWERLGAMLKLRGCISR